MMFKYSLYLNELTMYFVLCAIFACFTAIEASESSPCVTPNGEKAHCTPLRLCPILKQALTSGDALAEEFVEASTCPGPNEKFAVCCGTAGNFTQTDIKPTSSPNEKINDEAEKLRIRANALKKLLPHTSYCGQQHTDDYYFHDENNETSVDEFPWLLNLTCIHTAVNGQIFEVSYAGVLISNRYALTFVHCDNPYKVYIGQHRRDEKVTCMETQYGEYCNDPIQELNVTEHYAFDIFRLIRLQERIDYSDFIRPICLPIDESDKPKLNDTVIVSGWSATSHINPNYQKTKKKLELVIGNDDCSSKRNENYCALRLKNDTRDTDSCDGDEGGPMMYRKNNVNRNWYAVGTVIGTSCGGGTTIATQISTKVVDWILDNLRP